MVDSFRFNTLLGCRHRFTEIERMKGSINIPSDFAKSHLARLRLAMSWTKVTNNFIALFIGVPMHGYSRVFFPIHVVKVLVVE
jgi:hypothetical protein